MLAHAAAALPQWACPVIRDGTRRVASLARAQARCVGATAAFATGARPARLSPLCAPRAAVHGQITSVRGYSAATRVPGMPEAVPTNRIVRVEDARGAQHFAVLQLNDDGEVAHPVRASLLARNDTTRQWGTTGEVVDVRRVLPPLEPAAIYCIGLNYHAHAEETKQELPRFPVVFMKPPSAVCGAGDYIVVPDVALDPEEVDFEGELAVVIGRDCKDVSEVEALSYVLGYTIANDVSARRWQGKKGGGQWTRAKAFDTFCPLGPVLVPAGKFDPHSARITTLVNGEVMQDGNTKDMIFNVPQIIEFLSQGTTLQAGTVILTGTPAGVGYTRSPPAYLRPGDVVEVRIDGIGSLKNRVTTRAVQEIRSSNDEMRLSL